MVRSRDRLWCWLVLCWGSVVTESNIVCPVVSQSIKHFSGERYCYYMFSQPRTWQDAEDWCRDQDHGNLIAINSKSAQDVAVALVKSRNVAAYWIGTRQTLTTWNWLDGSHLGTYQPWELSASSTTNNGKRSHNNCVVAHITNGLHWSPRACAYHAGFLCQLPLSSPWCGPGTAQLADTCVHIYYGSVNWFLARETCSKMRGVLATLSDASISDQIVAQVNNSMIGYPFWTGLRRSQWTWTTGVEVLESSWDYGEPSDRGRCGAMEDIESSHPSGGVLWKARACNESLPYFCQIDMSPGEPEPTLSVLLPGGTYAARVMTSPPGGSHTTTPKTPIDEKKDRRGLTGGLVFLFLLLLVVLGGVVVLFFCYIRRGKRLRARARARAALANTERREGPSHLNPTAFVNQTFTVSDGMMVSEWNEAVEEAQARESGALHEDDHKGQSEKGETCGAHGDGKTSPRPGSNELALAVEITAPQDQTKPVKLKRPKQSREEVYKPTQEGQIGTQGLGYDLSLDLYAKEGTSRKGEKKAGHTGKRRKSPRDCVNSILDEALRVARRGSASTQQLIADDDDEPDDTDYSPSYQDITESQNAPKKKSKHPHQQQHHIRQRRHSTSGHVESDGDRPRRKHSRSHTAEDLPPEAVGSAADAGRRRHKRTLSMEDISSVSLASVSKPTRRQRPPADLPKPERKGKPEEKHEPSLDLEEQCPVERNPEVISSWDLGDGMQDMFDFDASGVGDAYEV